MILQKEVSEERGHSMIGKTLPVFVEGYMSADDVYVGRSYADAPDIDGLVFIHTDEELNTGDFIQVKIDGSLEYDLTGGLADNGCL